MDIKISLTQGEYRWLKALVKKAKQEAHHAFEETHHSLFELRRDNMADLEKKLNQANHIKQDRMQER